MHFTPISPHSITESLAERIRALVREEVTRALQEHQAAVDARSRAHTPAPAPHVHNPKLAQQQVQNLISSGQFNTAFKQVCQSNTGSPHIVRTFVFDGTGTQGKQEIDFPFPLPSTTHLCFGAWLHLGQLPSFFPQLNTLFLFLILRVDFLYRCSCLCLLDI